MPIIRLVKRLDLKDRGLDESSRIIIVNIGDRSVGFLAEQVKEVISIQNDIIDSVPEIAAAIDRQYILGVARLDDRLVILLDIDQILTDAE